MNIKTQQISGSFSALSTTATLTAPTNFTAVADVNKAFLIVSNTLKKGSSTSAGNQHLCHAVFTDASTITVTRYAAGNTATFEIQIIEFTGASGDPNEFIVRLHETVAFAAADTTKTGSTFSPTTKADCVPIICGISGQNFSDSAKDSAICAYITGASNTVTFERTSSTGAATVSYAVVEFIGSNWTVQEKQQNISATGESSITVNSYTPSETFIIASRQQANGSNRGSGLTWAVYPDSTTSTTIYVYQYTDSDNAYAGTDYRIYLVSNPVLNVTHFSGTIGTSTTSQNVDITSAKIDNAKSALICYGASDYNDAVTGNSYSLNVKYNSDTEVNLARASTDTSSILYKLQVIGFNNNSKQIPLTFTAQNSTNRKIALSLTGQSSANKNVIKLSFKPQAPFSRTINLTSQANENPLYLPYEPVISLEDETYHGFVATLSIQGSVDSLFQSTLATAYTKKKVIGLSWKGNEYGLLKFTFNCSGSGLPIKLSFGGVNTIYSRINYSLTGQNSNGKKIPVSFLGQSTTSNKLCYSFTAQTVTSNKLNFSFCGQTSNAVDIKLSFRTEDDKSYSIPVSLTGQTSLNIQNKFSFTSESDYSSKINLSFTSEQDSASKILLSYSGQSSRNKNIPISYCTQDSTNNKICFSLTGAYFLPKQILLSFTTQDNFSYQAKLSFRTQNSTQYLIPISYNGANSYAANLPLTFRAEQDNSYSIKFSFAASYVSNGYSPVFSFSAQSATQQNIKLSYTGQSSYSSDGNKLSFSGALSHKNKIAYSYSAQHTLYLNNKLSYTAQSVKSYHLPISLSAAFGYASHIKYSYAAISSLSCKIALSYMGGFSKSLSINFSFTGQRNIAESLKLSFASSNNNSSNIGLSFSGNYVKSAVFSFSFSSYSTNNQTIPLSYSAYSVSANKLKVSYTGQRSSANKILLSFNSYLSSHASHLYLSFNTSGSTKNKTIRLTFKVGPSRGTIIEYTKKPIIKPHYKPYNTTCE